MGEDFRGLGDALVGRWDPDSRLYVATGWTFGPAGPARVDLGAGVVLSVDYANPEVTNEVTIEAPLTGDPTLLDGATRRRAALLLGPETFGGLLALSGPGADDRSVKLSESKPGTAEQRRLRSVLSRFTVLAEMANDGDLSPLETALAAVEAAATAAIVVPALGLLGPPARDLAIEGGTALLDIAGRRGLEIAHDRARGDLAAAVMAAAGLLGDHTLARRMQRLADDIGRGRHRQRAAASRALGVAPPDAMRSIMFPDDAMMAGRPEPAAEDIGPAVEVDGPPGARAHKLGSEIQVRLSEVADEHLWARVFRRQDNLMLALAPLRGTRRARSAHLVIPPGLGPSELIVDVTDQPEAVRPSRRRAAYQAGVAFGRQACGQERIGNNDGAMDLWERSAEAHMEAGDKGRALIAQNYAEGQRAGRLRTQPRSPSRPGRDGPGPSGPFLSDLI